MLEKNKFDKRLDDQIRFVLEVDKLKNIFRGSYITDGSRRENDAEHSWHLALMVLLLSEYTENPNIDLFRVLGMVIVHDLVEIYTGDTVIYDIVDADEKAEREKKAADKLFSILPEDQCSKFRSLWEEFEELVTPEAKYARALDRLQPILLNYTNKGRTWKEHNVSFEKVAGLNIPIISSGAPGLENFLSGLLNEAKEKGFFYSKE